MLSGLARWIERRPGLHRRVLGIWKMFPPRLAGLLKGQLARNWIVGAVAVIVDDDVDPPEVLLVEHSYRSRGAWGLPGGSLESVPGRPTDPHTQVLPDDVLEQTLRREVREELGIGIEGISLLRVDAVPYVAEEPGPYRLDFYFRCRPKGGFAGLRAALAAGEFTPASPEIRDARLVPLPETGGFDLFSTDERFLRQDLPRLMPEIRRSSRAG
ncbi:NUDIX hydrolase [Aquisalimonas sp.]|uniref:NUDIX hydrolase n=1 Tax=Aquisalimonas sp. TaxID=1872621 RepID=UPI0025C51FE4|nr:NUDIX hydrolase [Aquisalimonas sp.]